MSKQSRKKRKNILFIWVAGVVALGLVGYGIWAMISPSSPSQPQQTVLNRPAPEIRFSDVDFSTWNLSDFYDRPTVVSFMALWCGVCELEIIEFERVQERNPGQFNFIMVDVDTERDTLVQVRAFANTYKNNDFYFVFDETNAIANAFGVSDLQTTFVINTDGEIVYMDKSVTEQPDLERVLIDL